MYFLIEFLSHQKWGHFVPQLQVAGYNPATSQSRPHWGIPSSSDFAFDWAKHSGLKWCIYLHVFCIIKCCLNTYLSVDNICLWVKMSKPWCPRYPEIAGEWILIPYYLGQFYRFWPMMFCATCFVDTHPLCCDSASQLIPCDLMITRLEHTKKWTPNGIQKNMIDNSCLFHVYIYIYIYIIVHAVRIYIYTHMCEFTEGSTPAAPKGKNYLVLWVEVWKTIKNPLAAPASLKSDEALEVPAARVTMWGRCWSLSRKQGRCCSNLRERCFAEKPVLDQYFGTWDSKFSVPTLVVLIQRILLGFDMLTTSMVHKKRNPWSYAQAGSHSTACRK